MTTSDAGSGAEGYANTVLPPPSGRLLIEVSGLMAQVHDPEERDLEDEELAESALRLVVGEIEALHINDTRDPETIDEANALVAAADEWISLASSICCRVYAPASPLPEKLLKWSRKVPEQLRQVCSLIERPVSAAARLLNASGWTLSVNFPWGASLGIGFETGLFSTIPLESISKQAVEIEDLRRQLADAHQRLADSKKQLAKTTADYHQARLRAAADKRRPRITGDDNPKPE